MKQTVFQANPFRLGSMGSMGNARIMIVRQFQFPNEYDSKLDKLIGADDDRLSLHDHDHVARCFREHVGGTLYCEDWFAKTEPEKIMSFMKDVFRADPNIQWTGFRILGSVHLRNGHDIWTLELFAKHPKSETVVYSERVAPNVGPG